MLLRLRRLPFAATSLHTPHLVNRPHLLDRYLQCLEWCFKNTVPEGRELLAINSVRVTHQRIVQQYLNTKSIPNSKHT
jgi:hypothetical protein